MMSTSDLAKKRFKVYAQEAPVGTNEVRWFCWYENVKQIYTKSASVNQVIYDERVFAESLRGDMKAMLDNPQRRIELKMELALAVDSGDKLVKLCYKQEGDGEFLCTTTFDHWNSVQETLHEMTAANTDIARLRDLLPNVTEIAESIHQNGPNHIRDQNYIIRQNAIKLLPIYQKMQYDSNNRLARTLRIFRATRLFNYKFIASQNIITLQQELVHLLNIQICYSTGEESYLNELKEYKRLSDLEMQAEDDDQVDISAFWLRYSLTLPIWFLASRDVGLIAPSSASLERAFSLLTQGFNDQQDAALEDYKATSVIIRFNNIWRTRDDN